MFKEYVSSEIGVERKGPCSSSGGVQSDMEIWTPPYFIEDLLGILGGRFQPTHTVYIYLNVRYVISN